MKKHVFSICLKNLHSLIDYSRAFI